MPELPEVETTKRYLDATALHQTIGRAHVGAARVLHGMTPQDLDRRLHGHALETTRRHGKYLFVRVDEAGWLVLHFGMTGRLQYAKSAGDLPQHAALLLPFENGAGLAYIDPRKFGRVDWTGDPDAYVAARGLGPDILTLGLADFRALAQGRRGSVKAWLMDQGIMAGIGNIYSDEILFQAGIHPRHSVTDLDEGKLEALHKALRRVLRQAVDAGAEPEAMPRSFLLPRRKAGARCPRCGGQVAQLKAGGRTAYYCPQCQPR